jgi:quercetin dioxygenase-like cupin family protein
MSPKPEKPRLILIIMEDMSLKIRVISQEPSEPMPGEGHHLVNTVMIVPKRDLSSFSCRLLRIEPGGSTANHSHTREHFVIALTGKARVETETEATEIYPGIIVNIPPNTPHRFINATRKKTVILVQNLYLEEM